MGSKLLARVGWSGGGELNGGNRGMEGGDTHPFMPNLESQSPKEGIRELNPK